jgi:hypothetical protein
LKLISEPIISILIFIPGLLLSACQISSLTSSFFETPSGAVLYQDDFSDPNSGWDKIDDNENGTMDYFDTFFRVQVLGDHQMLSNGPGLKFTDVQIEADMIKVVGYSDDLFGLICRAVDQKNFYFFVISSDGYYGVGKMIDGVQSMIGSPGMLPSEMISQGKTKNHLRVDCIGEQLFLAVNGQELVRVKDSDFQSGDVGIMAGTLNDLENVVIFDNFSVIKP